MPEESTLPVFLTDGAGHWIGPYLPGDPKIATSGKRHLTDTYQAKQVYAVRAVDEERARAAWQTMARAAGKTPPAKKATPRKAASKATPPPAKRQGRHRG